MLSELKYKISKLNAHKNKLFIGNKACDDES